MIKQPTDEEIAERTTKIGADTVAFIKSFGAVTTNDAVAASMAHLTTRLARAELMIEQMAVEVEENTKDLEWAADRIKILEED